MFSKTKIALSAAVVLSIAFPASAATKHHRVTDVHPAIYNMVIPAAAGGGCTTPHQLNERSQLNERQRTRLSNNHARMMRCAALSTTSQRQYTWLSHDTGPLLCHDQGQHG